MIDSASGCRRCRAIRSPRFPRIKRRLIEAGMDVIDLGAGDNDTPPPDAVRRGDAARPSSSRRSASTGSSRGCRRFGRRLSRWVERRFGMHFDPATETLPLHRFQGRAVAPAAGGGEPGRRGARARSRATRPISAGRILSGAVPHICPLRAERDFLLELDDVPADVLKRAKLVFVNYPNNPTAAVATPEYLDAAGEQLPQARHPARLRQRLLRADIRRLSRAEHLRDPGRARRRASSSSRCRRASR